MPAIEHAEFEGIERLALVTGAEIASNFGPGDRVKLGACDLVEEVMIGEDRVLRFSGLPLQGASTIVLRGANRHVLDEAERSMHDALCVLVQAVKVVPLYRYVRVRIMPRPCAASPLRFHSPPPPLAFLTILSPRPPASASVAQDRRVVLGAGCSEMLMARAVDRLATRTAGKRALAVEAFARALRSIPTILADNAGLDSQDLVARLRAAHYADDADTHCEGLGQQAPLPAHTGARTYCPAHCRPSHGPAPIASHQPLTPPPPLLLTHTCCTRTGAAAAAAHPPPPPPPPHLPPFPSPLPLPAPAFARFAQTWRRARSPTCAHSASRRRCASRSRCSSAPPRPPR